MFGGMWCGRIKFFIKSAVCLGISSPDGFCSTQVQFGTQNWPVLIKITVKNVSSTVFAIGKCSVRLYNTILTRSGGLECCTVPQYTLYRSSYDWAHCQTLHSGNFLNAFFLQSSNSHAKTKLDNQHVHTTRRS